jgi:hypothetical protein
MFIVLRAPKSFRSGGAPCKRSAATARGTPKGVLHISSLREL